METKKADLIIIGAGLTGLALAYYLREESINIHLIEARERKGGRIQTKYASAAAPLEMGATWFGRTHHQVVGLLTELQLGSFEQLLGERAIYEPISTSPHQIVQLPASPSAPNISQHPALPFHGGGSQQYLSE